MTLAMYANSIEIANLDATTTIYICNNLNLETLYRSRHSYFYLKGKILHTLSLQRSSKKTKIILIKISLKLQEIC